jgi:hypothetical protein
VLCRYTLILTMGGLLIGCLSYHQMSLASCLSWPYVVPMYQLALEVRKMRQQELEVLQQTADDQQQAQAVEQNVHLDADMAGKMDRL